MVYWLIRHACALLLICAPACTQSQAAESELALPKISGAKPRNVIFILIDDMRYDVMGFAGHPFARTPNIDALAAAGVHFRNAFVTTALCSPSRASVLTGKYAHKHKVVDNNSPIPAGTTFFPQYLQQAGYATAFIGKWHMGNESDEPQPCFDRWVSFLGQGQYYAPGPNYRLNVDGKQVPLKGFMTDELTDYAIDWLKQQKGDKPFFLYLSHKAVHSPFKPAKRHESLYADVDVPEPATQADTEENYRGKPMWLKNQRNSHHGVDFPYHASLDIKEYYRDYCRTLAAVDDSVGRIMQLLKEQGRMDDTVVFFMGDNGFMFGEHGLIDKRCAYEESMRVPLVISVPGLFPAGSKVEGVVANIDIAPTILELAGLKAPAEMDGRSFVDLGTGKTAANDWRKNLLYEYYWEWSYPQTPTTFALRGDQYKFIQYHGIWDTDELYDLQADPHEMKNLIEDPQYTATVKQMRNELDEQLRQTGGAEIPFGKKMSRGQALRKRSGPPAAQFPESILRDKNAEE